MTQETHGGLNRTGPRVVLEGQDPSPQLISESCKGFYKKVFYRRLNDLVKVSLVLAYSRLSLRSLCDGDSGGLNQTGTGPWVMWSRAAGL